MAEDLMNYAGKKGIDLGLTVVTIVVGVIAAITLLGGNLVNIIGLM